VPLHGSPVIRVVAGVGEVEALVGQGKSARSCWRATPARRPVEKDGSTTFTRPSWPAESSSIRCTIARATLDDADPLLDAAPRRRPRGWTHRGRGRRGGEDPSEERISSVRTRYGEHVTAGVARGLEGGQESSADATRGVEGEADARPAGPTTPRSAAFASLKVAVR